MTDNSVICMGGQRVALRRGRLIFALDATASREPTWAITKRVSFESHEALAIRRMSSMTDAL
jgi:hypothetical protein